MILFRNGLIFYKVAVELKVPAFTYGQMLLGISVTEHIFCLCFKVRAAWQITRKKILEF